MAIALARERQKENPVSLADAAMASAVALRFRPEPLAGYGRDIRPSHAAPANANRRHSKENPRPGGNGTRVPLSVRHAKARTANQEARATGGKPASGRSDRDIFRNSMLSAR